MVFNNKCLGYFRVSTAEQSTHSPEAQQEQIKKYCELYGLELEDIEGDDGISGRGTKNRPGFNFLMAKVRNREINHVVVYSISRLARNTADFLNAMEEMAKHDVTFHSITDRINTEGATGKLMLTILAAMSQFDSDQKSEVITSAKKFCKENGRTYSGPIFGFHNDLSSHTLVPIEKEIKTVKMVFSMSKTMNINAITNELNQTGVRTKKGCFWRYPAVKSILTNSIYAPYKV